MRLDRSRFSVSEAPEMGAELRTKTPSMLEACQQGKASVGWSWCALKSKGKVRDNSSSC
jgi:hypothetical protein